MRLFFDVVLFLYGVSSSTSSVSSSARVYSNAWSSEAEGDEARAYPQRLTGVDDARLAMYSAVAGGAWLQCNHNSTRVPPTRVNDGYCDCLVDGLDEIATSACSGVAQEDTHFWCANRGLQPTWLPTSRVSDGVCDCCDGADELINPHVMCPDTCSEGWEEVAERRRVLRAGAMKRAALVVDVAAEVENQRKRLELMDSEVRMVEAFALSLKWHEGIALSKERSRRRLELLDQWVDGADRTVCVEPAPKYNASASLADRRNFNPSVSALATAHHDDDENAYKAAESNASETKGGYANGEDPNQKKTSADGGRRSSAVQSSKERQAESRKRKAQQLHALKQGATCVTATRPPTTMTKSWSASEAPVARIKALELAEGPQAGLSLGVYLERLFSQARKKNSQRFATSQQYLDETTLLSWLINHAGFQQRVATLGLLAVGTAAAPLTWPLGWLMRQMARTRAGEYVVYSWTNFTATIAGELGDEEAPETTSRDGFGADIETASPLEQLAELTSGESLFYDSRYSSSSRVSSSSRSGGGVLHWLWSKRPEWRRFGWLRRLVSTLRSVVGVTTWARQVVWHAPSTVAGLVGPEWTPAWRRGLLSYTYDVALLKAGLRSCEMELEVMRGGRDKLSAELKFYDDPMNPGDLWFPFRSKCFEFRAPHGSSSIGSSGRHHRTMKNATYEFCPMQENKMDGLSLGKFEKWGRVGPSRNRTITDLELHYHLGSRQQCPAAMARSSTVKAVCAEKHALINVVETKACHFKFTFGTPIACTAEVVDAEEADLPDVPELQQGMRP